MDARHTDDHEQQRLEALRSLDILDTPAEEAFDRITQMAADLFDAPIALISLVDASRQWFKSKVGLNASETSRDVSFCDHVIRGNDVMVIPDAMHDARFSDNPLVTGDPNIRFYAGAPLRLASGQNLGSLCVIDSRPRPQLTALGRRRLETLAKIAVDEMELRVKTRQLEIAMAAAHAAAQAKSDFLANMSHELRTPLTSIIGFAGLMSASPDLKDRERHFAERIQNASNNLLALVNDVLDFAKLEGGHVTLNREDVPLRAYLEGIIGQFHDQAAAKGLVLSLTIDPSAPDVIDADPHALRQILANLLSNAVKFTSAGRIALIAEPSADGLSLTVRDTGVGIAPQALDQVFDRFVQADNSISRKFGGTGLGLSISRRLTELMGGALTVHSTPDEGSAFALNLPLI